MTEKDSLDITQELRTYIQEIKSAEEKNRQAEGLRLKWEEERSRRKAQEAQEEELLRAAYNERGRKIIEESGVRGLLEQARIGLAEIYPNIIMAEMRETYNLRLAWGPNPTSTDIKDIWVDSDDSKDKRFFYIGVNGHGLVWNKLMRKSEYALGIRFRKSTPLEGIVGWQDPDILKRTILEAIKHPLRVWELARPVSYVDHTHESRFHGGG